MCRIHAGLAQNVVVTNDASHPVPVKSVDPQPEVFHWTGTVSSSSGTPGTRLVISPKRGLVVEHVSIESQSERAPKAAIVVTSMITGTTTKRWLVPALVGTKDWISSMAVKLRLDDTFQLSIYSGNGEPINFEISGYVPNAVSNNPQM